MDTSSLIRVVEDIRRPRVLVLGDLILDRYIWGDVERISPEAPIPVLNQSREEARVGGAGNAATNVAALGAEVAIWGLVGDDADGALVTDWLRRAGVDSSAVSVDGSRVTTVKTRVMGLAQKIHPQQLLRIDHEDTHPVSAALAEQCMAFLSKAAAHCDAIIVSDYGKGTLSTELLAYIFAAARKAGVRTIVDPARGRPLCDYRGADILKPNRFEASIATGIALDSETGLQQAIGLMIGDLDLKAAIITLDKDGMYVGEGNGSAHLVSTRPRSVYDVTGAGDMVTATLAWALAGGVPLDQAVALANVTGGLEVERLGVTPISRAELLTELRREQSTTGEKVKSLPELLRELDRCRRSGLRIVWTNGCFDLLHPGHTEYLAFARRQGDLLVVGINSDASVRRLKGPHRPIIPESERARILSALTAVDYVVIFDDDTPIDYIKQVHPEVLVKGEDWREKGVVGREEVEAYGGKVVLAPVIRGFSTTNIVEQVLTLHGVNGRNAKPHPAEQP